MFLEQFLMTLTFLKVNTQGLVFTAGAKIDVIRKLKAPKNWKIEVF